MPITGKQFELGIDSAIEEWMKKIHSFLVEHRDEASTQYELAEQLDGFSERYKKLSFGAVGVVAEFNSTFEMALEKLVETRAVESRLVRGQSYYRVGR